MELLLDLNKKIEKANAVNRESLIVLETLKAKIAFYERIACNCRRTKKFEYEFNEKSERIKVEKEALVDQAKTVAVLAELKKEKDTLEEKINTANFNIIVDFDPENVLSRL